VLRTPVVLLEAHVQKCIKNLANQGILGIAEKLLTRRAKLLHLIKANLKDLRSYGKILLTCSDTSLNSLTAIDAHERLLLN
jgi:hypothetical protein